MSSAIMNKNFPYRKYIKHAVSGVSDQDVFVMTRSAIIYSIGRIEADGGRDDLNDFPCKS